MNLLSNKRIESREKRPVRILQFGEGNFLRAFVNWMVHRMNKEVNFNAGVSVVQPIENGLIHMLDEQDGLYTCYLNGIKGGEVVSENEIIECIQRTVNPYKDFDAYLEEARNPDLRFIVSNTTEAGISYSGGDSLNDRPQKSFPAKLTSLLYERHKHFSGDPSKGVLVIPCELIENNGGKLKELILKIAEEWELGNEFINWLSESNTFYNTLVDRIVPGYPRSKIEEITNELGYKDNLVVEGEQFHLWVIEGPLFIQEEFPAEDCGLNVIFTDNLKPYRTRKVRILNGAHTSLVPVGYLYGIEHVRESVEDPVVGTFLKKLIYEEIVPTLDLGKEELESFAGEVIDRFRNPYLKHALISISLNSISKFKTRVLPSLLKYAELYSNSPERIAFSFSSLIVFYRGLRRDEQIPLNDSENILQYFRNLWGRYDSKDLQLAGLVKEVLRKEDFWEQDLYSIPGLSGQMEKNISEILSLGINKAITNL